MIILRQALSPASSDTKTGSLPHRRLPVYRKTFLFYCLFPTRFTRDTELAHQSTSAAPSYIFSVVFST